ncbi:UNVERIFIED_CONTAM: Pro-Pol polyprotein [Sesamum indicum]
MEVYIDDMLVKNSRSPDHMTHLEQTFAILRKFRMKLNPTKCTFGVTGGKFLGYMVNERGIEANPAKIEAILKLRSPTTIKEVQQLIGKLASLNRFISKSSDRNLPFFKVLRKTKNFEWTEECEQAFQDLKTYLRSPPLLTNLKRSEALYLYLAISENVVSSALIREEEGVQNPIYYVSKMLQGAEKRYTQIEKLALTLVVTARKLRSYFQGHRIIVLTNHPLRSVLARPYASGRLVKWAVELGKYDIEYQARTSLKGQVLADFMVELVGEPEKNLEVEKWMLHVDGSSNAGNRGVGILIQDSKDVEIEVAVRLSFIVTNNEAEYEALIMGLELAFEAGARNLEIPRCENYRADSLSKFGAMLSGIRDRKITVMIKDAPAISKSLEIIQYLRDGALPPDPLSGRRLKAKARAEYVMREIHERSCENHSGGRSLAQKVIRQGFFWPTLVKDTKELVKKCEACQKFAAQIHTPAVPLEPIKVACPFDRWGIDILGLFPTARSQKKFIIVAVEYFSKWIEAEAVARVIEGVMIDFIWKNIICRFRVPRILVEVSNRTILQHLKTRLGSKGSWLDELPGVLWAYRTTPRFSTGERIFDLEVIEEKREIAHARMLHHKGLMLKSSNKRLKPRQLQVGDLVLKKVEVSRHVGKLDPSWEGPYKVTEIKRRGTYQDMEGRDLPRPWNIQNLKKFYA